jgi:hypothetical protein
MLSYYFSSWKFAPIKKKSTTLSQIQTIKDATGVYENEAVQLRVNSVFLKDRPFIPLLYQKHQELNAAKMTNSHNG